MPSSIDAVLLSGPELDFMGCGLWHFKFCWSLRDTNQNTRGIAKFTHQSSFIACNWNWQLIHT